MNNIVQSLWIGSELSVMEQLSIKSFLANGHEYHLYIYGYVKGIPKGTVIKDGKEILPENRIFTYQSGWGKGSYAGFADLFRYHLLRKKGSWWVDTDVVCLKHFALEEEHVICSSNEANWGNNLANSCVLKLPNDSKLSNYLCNACDSQDPTSIGFGDIGPRLVQRAVVELNLQKYVVPYETFCPITWRAVDKIVRPCEELTVKKAIKSIKKAIKQTIIPSTKPGKITNKTYAVHLWNEIWRQNNLDKNASYDKKCLYECLKKQYL